MDPDAALAGMRDLCHDYDQAGDCETKWQIAAELVDTFQGLDSWMSREGFPPDARQREGDG
jgi:hypothetical protein